MESNKRCDLSRHVQEAADALDDGLSSYEVLTYAFCRLCGVTSSAYRKAPVEDRGPQSYALLPSPCRGRRKPLTAESLPIFKMEKF